MTVADRIGLLPGFGWIAGHPFWVTVLICWAITPGMMIVIGIVGESRLIPLTPDKQFLGFFPGDLFLGVGVAAALQAAARLPAEAAWWNQRWLHLVAVLLATIFAAGMIVTEVTSGKHPIRETLSPVGLYHGVALYGGYGYVIGVVAIATIAGSDWSDTAVQGWTAVAVTSAVAFIGFVLADGLREFDSSQTYTEDWKPIWRRHSA